MDKNIVPNGKVREELRSFGDVDQMVLITAKTCHHANKAYCESLGDRSQEDWANSLSEIREEATKGVWFCFSNPESQASDVHDAWVTEKICKGWKYGAVKDVEKKEHPCCVPFNKLPAEHQRKVFLFMAVCDGVLKGFGSSRQNVPKEFVMDPKDVEKC